MKLLIVTQVVDVNHPILGFFHRWIVEFSKQFESVVVICLQKGVYDMPHNVKILSLGKEQQHSRSEYLARFYKYVWNERGNYDAVFVHMNPMYVILGGVLWKLLGKKIVLWYTHKNVDAKLVIAEKIADTILTASKESFRLSSKKLHIVGHGIDTNIFSPDSRALSRSQDGDKHDRTYRIVSVGRISPAKNQMIMVKAVDILRNRSFHTTSCVVGAPATGVDRSYEQKIKVYIESEHLGEAVSLIGPVKPEEIPNWYREADLFINLSDTGSLDKAVLEAMSSGLQVLTSNEAFEGILPAENITHTRPAEVADKIMQLQDQPVSPALRQYVVEHHNISVLIPRISSIIKS